METSNETPTTSAAVAAAASATEIATATKCGAYKIITFFLNVNMRKATLFFSHSQWVYFAASWCLLGAKLSTFSVYTRSYCSDCPAARACALWVCLCVVCVSAQKFTHKMNLKWLRLQMNAQNTHTHTQLQQKQQIGSICTLRNVSVSQLFC